MSRPRRDLGAEQRQRLGRSGRRRDGVGQRDSRPLFGGRDGFDGLLDSDGDCLEDGDCAVQEDGNRCNGTLHCVANDCVLDAEEIYAIGRELEG